MTQEEKQLLLVDLSARLPYNVQIHGIFTDIDYSKDEDEDGFIFENEYDTYLSIETFDWFIHGSAKIKPYLRPMPSMTEEDKEELLVMCPFVRIQDDDWIRHGLHLIDEINGKLYICYSIGHEAFDWLNKHMFDYRGLIEKGLALPATEDMYKK